jgi:hypothetical protein
LWARPCQEEKESESITAMAITFVCRSSCHSPWKDFTLAAKIEQKQMKTISTLEWIVLFSVHVKTSF